MNSKRFCDIFRTYREPTTWLWFYIRRSDGAKVSPGFWFIHERDKWIKANKHNLLFEEFVLEDN